MAKKVEDSPAEAKTEPAKAEEKVEAAPVVAKFVYNGPDDESFAYGIVFAKGKPVEIRDEYKAGRLSNNKSFTKV